MKTTDIIMKRLTEAVYRCDNCERFIDDDEFPMEQVNGRDICPDCYPDVVDKDYLEDFKETTGVDISKINPMDISFRVFEPILYNKVKEVFGYDFTRVDDYDDGVYTYKCVDDSVDLDYFKEKLELLNKEFEKLGKTWNKFFDFRALVPKDEDFYDKQGLVVDVRCMPTDYTEEYIENNAW